MKKIGIISLAAAVALTFSACGVGDVGGASSGSKPSASSQSVSSAESSQMPQGSVSDNLNGLEKYLSANASFSGSPTSMRADMIGAVKGDCYQFGYNGKNNVTVELYEYDLSHLNGTAKKVRDEVKSSGRFTIMNQQVDATLSDSGKYLMVLKNTATDSQNKAYDEKVKELFAGFKK